MNSTRDREKKTTKRMEQERKRGKKARTNNNSIIYGRQNNHKTANLPEHFQSQFIYGHSFNPKVININR